MVLLGFAFDSSGKITLDQETFKVLASETRIGILKKLDNTQMTVSDLARAMDMSKATLLEHLEKLIKTGLIKKKEDQRKWVYYKLTWKGKNVLHPEKTKIAIVLTLSIIFIVVLSAFIAINLGYDIFNSKSKDIDLIAPTIQFSKVNDITEKTKAPLEIQIELEDNKKIDKSSLVVDFAIFNKYTKHFNLITSWQVIDSVVESDRVLIEIPISNWNNHTGEYFYLRCSISDTSGNQAQNVFVDYIDKIYEGSIDLSIHSSDVIFEKPIRSLTPPREQNIPIKLKVHNTGSIDVRNINISIFINNPDLHGDGLVDNISNSLINQNIEFIEHESVVIIEIEMRLNLSITKQIWIALDPINKINETNELNNIIEVDVKSGITESIIPEFPSLIALFIMIFILWVNIFFKKRM